MGLMEEKKSQNKASVNLQTKQYPKGKREKRNFLNNIVSVSYGTHSSGLIYVFSWALKKE